MANDLLNIISRAELISSGFEEQYWRYGTLSVFKSDSETCLTEPMDHENYKIYARYPNKPQPN